MLAPIEVAEVMQAPVETVGPDAPARAAAARLHEQGIGSLVVTEGGDPVGIVTEGDLADLVAAGRDPDATPVEAVMASPLTTVRPEATVETAAERMHEAAVTRLPVLENGAVVGIVTTRDLSKHLLHLVRLGREGGPVEGRERAVGRADTAYEHEDWTFEYVGGADSIDVGDAVRFSKTLSAADVEAFAAASGDTNRLHLDGAYAAGTRFGGRIAHGTLVAGVVSAALARLPGLIIYLSQDVSYLGPVPVGERVTAECEVVEDIGEGRFRLSTVVRGGEERVIDGEAVVIADDLPDGSAPPE